MSLSILHPAPARIGRYTLSKEHSVQRRLCINDPHFSQATSFNIDLAAGVLPRSSILFVPTAYLPTSITQDFKHAGKRFMEDLRACCSMVGFCDQIELDGRRAGGFVPDMVADNGADALTSGLDQLTANKVMFVNRRFEDGRPMPDILFSEPMSWLLGRLKVNSLLTINGQSLAALTPNGKDLFATRYRLAFQQSLFERLKAKASEAFPGFSFETTGMGANVLNDIRKTEEQITLLDESMTSSDRLVLTVLET